MEGLTQDLLESDAVKNILVSIGLPSEELNDPDVLNYILSLLNSSEESEYGACVTLQHPQENPVIRVKQVQDRLSNQSATASSHQEAEIETVTQSSGSASRQQEVHVGQSSGSSSTPEPRQSVNASSDVGVSMARETSESPSFISTQGEGERGALFSKFFAKRKENSEPGLTKEDIGTPMNFRHCHHFGLEPPPRYETRINEVIKELLIRLGVSEQQLRDQRNVELIYELTEHYGGTEAVIRGLLEEIASEGRDTIDSNDNVTSSTQTTDNTLAEGGNPINILESTVATITSTEPITLPQPAYDNLTSSTAGSTAFPSAPSSDSDFRISQENDDSSSLHDIQSQEEILHGSELHDDYQNQQEVNVNSNGPADNEFQLERHLFRRLRDNIRNHQFRSFINQIGMTEHQLQDPETLANVFECIDLNGGLEALGLDSNTSDSPTSLSVPDASQPALEEIDVRLSSALQGETDFTHILDQMGITQEQRKNRDIMAALFNIVDMTGDLLNLNTDEQEFSPLETAGPVREEDDDDCVVCSEAPRNYAAIPCGHRAFCEGCCKLLEENNSLCPICRQNVECYIKIIT